MRTIVDLPDQQLSALSDFCKIRGISRAEAVRRAVDRMLEEETSHQGFHKAFGGWKSRDMDSTDYVRELREEWDR